jgi:hypothetical protein
MQAHRQIRGKVRLPPAFVPSGAKDDPSDAQTALELLLRHPVAANDTVQNKWVAFHELPRRYLWLNTSSVPAGEFP